MDQSIHNFSFSPFLSQDEEGDEEEDVSGDDEESDADTCEADDDADEYLNKVNYLFSWNELNFFFSMEK